MNELRLILIIVGFLLLLGIYWVGRRDEKIVDKKALSAGGPVRAHTPYDLESKTYIEDPFSHDEMQADHNTDDDHFFIEQGDDEIFHDAYIPVKSKSANIKITAVGHRPDTHASQAIDGPTPLLVPATDTAPQVVTLPTGIDPLIIHLTVMALSASGFEPNYLKQNLEDTGLVHGELNIYHYYRKSHMELEPENAQKLFSVAKVVEPGFFDPQQINSYKTPGISLFLQLPGPIGGVLAFEKMHQIAQTLAKRLGGVLCDDKHNKLTAQTITHIKDQISEYHLKLQTKLKQTIH